MIADLKPYPEYKRTEIEWLGGLPTHWNELSLKRVAFSENSGCFGGEPGIGVEILPVATTAQIDRDGNFAVSRMPRRGFTEEEVARYCCKAGDILVVKSSGSAANVISGKAGIVRMDTPRFVFSNFLMRFVARPTHIVPEYLFLLLTCNLTRQRVKRMVSTTTYPNLRVGEYCSALLPIPPLAEQAAIVRFLDWANGRLERAIRAKRKVIALLNEQKQAIIHQAVTRGLDPSAPPKPSGIPWLGDIPQHWDVKPIKRMYREVDERTVTGREELLSVSHLTGVTPRSQKSITMFMAASYVGHKICHPNDIVTNTMWMWMGALGVSAVTGLVSPSYAVYRPDSSAPVLSAFVDLALRTRAYVEEFTRLSTGIRPSRLRLYPEQFLRMPMLVPPLSEQEAICLHITEATAEINSAAAKERSAIDLIHEYRTRLIVDIVTGKFDVRGLDLPDVDDTSGSLVDAPEALDELADEELEEAAL